MLEFKNIEKVKKEEEQLKNITNVLSIIRLVLAVAALVFLIIGISYEFKIYGSVGIGLTIVFILYSFFTNKYYKELELVKNKILTYESHEKRRKGLYHTFKDSGKDLLNKEDFKESDLDLFGNHSLFQYLSSAKTKYGRNMLKDALTKGSDTDYRDLCYKLADNEDTIVLESSVKNFEGSKNTDYDSLYESLGTKINLTFMMIFPLLSFIGMLIYIPFIFISGLNPWFLVIFVAINIVLCKLCLVNPIFLLNADSYYSLCEKYLDVRDASNSVNIDDELYNSLKKSFNENYSSVKNTMGILNLLAYRKNVIFNILANGLFSFDFFIILIYNMKTKKQDGLKEFFISEGHLEVALSFANIGIDNNVYTKGEESNSINAIDMYHPLVKNCISNSIEINGGIILTGSNMSGKTTFMRTLGICQTLFNAKGLIPAYSYSSSNINIYTSLRANDMLSEGISTFYAEILRMKDINQAIKEKKNLILVDEIFKGTNASERIDASFKVIDKLNSFNQFFIISTHDFELCNAKNIMNYHFNETYLDNKISFDYKIKMGKSETKNAIYLLKMANIIE
ncbi:MAG: hypothetical protein K6F81_01435 [Acholeplasmatales bacterium]|nr:hypothetical protein [Acholeplasmatales bacterium]